MARLPHEMNVDCGVHAFTAEQQAQSPCDFQFFHTFLLGKSWDNIASAYVLQYHTYPRYSSDLMFMSTFVHSQLSFILLLELPLSQTLSRFSIFDFLI